ncbi:MAG: CocE/NonD family hydrolase [Gemmataceae bacterium]|nr:CocE/NonD family hydrolase [Gemmataceae bacterium]
MALLPVPSIAQSPEQAKDAARDQIKEQYTKYEYRIPMRDGKKLFTAVYVPKDDTQKFPILLKRTPYSCKPYGADQYPNSVGPSPLFSKAGYIFAIQDVRGRWMSEGEFVNMRPQIAKKNGSKDVDESTDTYDTIEWLIKHLPNHNGRVGQYGISYPGFYTAAGMIDAHPALKASSPQAPVIDWFMGDDWHHNGALFLPHIFNFMANFGHPRPEPTKKSKPPFEHDMVDGYKFFLELGPLPNANARYFKENIAFWNEAMKHGTYDEFWQARNLRPHINKIKPAVMTVGGWFDAENLFGALETFKRVEATSPSNTNHLIMGPWLHGGWEGGRGDGDSLGHVKFNAKTSEFYREKIELPFFEFHLKGKGEQSLPKAWVFETGTNQWRRHDSWPPKKVAAKSLYLRANGKLAMEAPAESDADGNHDEYVSDPAKPVPFMDKIAIGMAAEYMVGDQRFAGRRPDVLVYESDVLQEDLTIAGPLQVELHVSTSGTDSDWIVKLIDVYPDDFPDPNPNPAGVRMGGFQQLVRGDVMRGKFRNSFEKPEPFVPNKPTAVKFTVPDSYHTFRGGHRIMVQVQSTWFPLVDRNPQTFVDIYSAKDTDFKKATQRVYRTREMPSRVTVLAAP